jgi:phage/conjugal plasmid C-4 type zinc finger TraR family protein
VAKDDFQYNNEEEAEMAQLHSIHNNMNHIAAVQRALAEQAARESLSECEECGEAIPELRRTSIKGCTRCVHCQELWEFDRKMHARPGQHED